MKPNKYVIYLLTLFLFNAVFPQDGALDLSFDGDGFVITDFNNGQDFGYSVVQSPDEKLYVIGSTDVQNEYYPSIIRYLEDGSLDSEYGDNGRLVLNLGSGFNLLRQIFVQNDGKIVVYGILDYFGDEDTIIARYLVNGDADTTFGTNGQVIIPNQDFEISKIVLDSNENILLYGSTNGQSIFTFSRLLANGSLDTSFGVNGYADSANTYGPFELNELKIVESGELFVLGHRDTPNYTDIIVIKFLSSGFIDTSFGDNGLVTNFLPAVTSNNFSSAGFDVGSSGKILIVGSMGHCEGPFEPRYQPFLLQYLANGAPDPSFGNNGTILKPITSFVMHQVIIQHNGKLLVRGESPDCFEGAYFFISRYNPDGSTDTSFIDLGYELAGTDMILQSDGKIVGLAYTWWYSGPEDIVLVRLHNDPLIVSENITSSFSIYPNPSDGIFTIKTMSGFTSEMRYVVTDVSGKIIQKSTITDIHTDINLSEASNGLYFLKVSEATFKLLKN